MLGYYKKDSSSLIETETLYLSGFASIDINNDDLLDFMIGSGEGNIRLFINNHQDH